MFRTIIKRFCHHHSKNILYLPKPCNPLVECESKYIKTPIEETKENKETKIYVENYKLVHSQNKYLPIEIQYFDNKKMCKVTIFLSK